MVDDLIFDGRRTSSGMETDGERTGSCTSSRFGDIGAAQVAGSKTEDSVPMFFSPAVDTPLVFDQKTKTLIPPDQ